VAAPLRRAEPEGRHYRENRFVDLKTAPVAEVNDCLHDNGRQATDVCYVEVNRERQELSSEPSSAPSRPDAAGAYAAALFRGCIGGVLGAGSASSQSMHAGRAHFSPPTLTQIA
jgi:hypothetical protein